MVQALSTNTFGTAKWIVSSDATQGTHTTIASALTSASSGDTIFIRPGTYTENLTLKAGVNLAAYPADAFTPNVTIVGKCSFSSAGTATISNIKLQTNSDYFLSVTGSVASVVYLYECNLTCSNNTGIQFTSSSASAAISLNNCVGNISTTGITYFTHSSAGFLGIFYSVLGNSGNATTASTASAGSLKIFFSSLAFPITTSSTNQIIISGSEMNTELSNAVCLTCGGTGSGSNYALNSSFYSGSANCVSIGSTLRMTECSVDSSGGSTVVTGAGTLEYSDISLIRSGTTINTTTRTGRTLAAGGLSFDGGTNVLSTYTATTTWTPTLLGASVAGSTTYTTQYGKYVRIGNLVFIEGTIVITAATGTGNATIGGLPFTILNETNYFPAGVANIAAAGWGWPASNTMMTLRGTLNTTNCTIGTTGSGAASNLQMTNAAATILFNMWYRVA